MRILKVAVFAVLVAFFSACGVSDKNIVESSSGTIDTTENPKIVFSETIADESKIYDNSGEIMVNGEEFFGRYLIRNNELVLLQNQPFYANKDYKISFDFKAINDKTNAKIKSKTHKMSFKTAELIVESPSANFINSDSGKIRLEAQVELSQAIPQDSIKENIKVLDSKNNEVEFEILHTTPKSFKILTNSLDSPKENDENYQIIFDKKLGLSEKKNIIVIATKSYNLEFIGAKALNSGSVELRFSENLANNLNLKDFIKLSPSIDFSVAQANNTINIKANFTQNQKYSISIQKGIKSQSGKSLAKSYEAEINIYDIEPKIIFSNDGVFLPESAQQKIAFKSINVKKATIRISKIYENNITQFLTQGDLWKKSSSDSYFYNFDYLGDIIARQEIAIDSKKNEWVQNEISLEAIKDKSGIFIVSINFDKDGVDYSFPVGTAEWKQRNYFYDNGSVNKQIILSNLALIAHKAGDDIIASTLDIRTNNIISGVEVSVISKNNQIISQEKSDSNGNVRLKYKIDEEFRKFDAFYLLAQKGSDTAIIKLNAQEISNDGFDTGGISAKNGIKAFIYTDRGVYRPGEKINLNIIARNAQETQTRAVEHPIKLTIRNPQGKKHIDKLSVKPFGDGVYYYEFSTEKNAPTGIYNVSVDIGDNVFTHQVAVESIIPNRIKVEINAKDSINLAQTKTLQMSLQSDYLFGAPASGLKYDIEVSTSPKKFISKNYSGWVFDNPTNLGHYNYGRETSSGNLDERGFMQEDINFKENVEYVNENLNATITARVYENNGRVVSNRKVVELKKFDSFVGIKMPQSKYIKQGEHLKIPVVLLDESENLLPNRKLEYKVYINNYSWWWDYDNYNEFIRSIKSDKNTNIIAQGTINTSDKMSYVEFEAQDRGEILLEVRDVSNNRTASIFLYASSWGEPLDANKIMQLKIKSDKSEYTHNQEAKITFESVKDSKALVVISNNENILGRYWIDTKDLQTTTSVRIDEKYAPNIYVSVFLLQNYKQSDNDRSLRLYGVVPLKIVDNKTKLDVKINTKDEILPNSTLEVEISNAQNKEAIYTLALVDEGIIGLTNFKTPSPWDYFYAKTKLGINSYDTYDYIIAKTSGKVNKVYTIGGDEAYSAGRANKQRDENAERFKNVVFFEKPFKSDKNGYAKKTFKIPSYLGSLRVMVVAVDKNSFGSTDKEVRVNAPVVMMPTIPRSLKIGDNFKLPIEVMRIKDSVKNAKISLKSDGIVKFDKATQSLNLSDKKSKTIFFNGQVGEELGIENIAITLESSDFKMQDSTQIDIKAPNPYTLLSTNYTLNGGKSLSVESPSKFVKNSSTGKITLSSSPILGIDHRLLWLIRYPYGCIEQTTSSVFPQLFIDKLSSADFIDKETMIKNINAAIARIATFQTSDGGFSYWQGEGESDAWGSSYAAHFLIMAKKQGYYVSEEVLKRWVNYQSRNISQNNAYPLYLLALSDNTQLGAMNEMYENNLRNLNIQNRWILAATYKIAGFDDIAKKITNGLGVAPKDDENYYRYSYGSNLRDKAMILNAYYEIYGEINQVLYDDIKRELESQEWLSTQTTAYALLTLANIKGDSKDSKIEGKITLNGDTKSFNEKSERITFDLDSGKAEISSPKNLFINYTWEGIVLDNKGDNIAKNMRLSREFVEFDDYGNESVINPREMDSAKSFYIKLTLSPLNNNRLNLQNIALTQNLPSGWEIENTRLNNDILPQAVQNAEQSTTYTDIRDDKIMWFFDLYGSNGKVVYVKINTITPGDYTLPSAFAEAMYDNNYQASTDSFRVKVK